MVTIKNIFSVVDGKIVSCHIGRDGKMKDIRPALISSIAPSKIRVHPAPGHTCDSETLECLLSCRRGFKQVWGEDYIVCDVVVVEKGASPWVTEHLVLDIHMIIGLYAARKRAGEEKIEDLIPLIRGLEAEGKVSRRCLFREANHGRRNGSIYNAAKLLLGGDIHCASRRWLEDKIRVAISGATRNGHWVQNTLAIK